jgi:NAD(P)-dependent dehydrogenase (short-subunit alcohol dehydrogenase family)
MGFRGQVALITGGTAGIGEATVRLVASLGARVVFVGRDRLKGERLERELTSVGNEVVFLRADLRVVEEARETVPFVVQRFGHLNYALNNAGTLGEIGLVTEQTEENFDELFSLNVKALFLTLQAELQQMVRQVWVDRSSTWLQWEGC